MAIFSVPGGRLLRVVFLFTVVCVVAIVIMTLFINRAMDEVLQITLNGNEVPVFYTQLISYLQIDKVIQSLSGVLIAIVARYGLRESTKNIGSGMSAKSSIPSGGTTVLEKDSAK
jgi:hypothetical protein